MANELIFIRSGVAGLLVLGLSAGLSHAQKFYPDDPLTEEPELVPTTDLEPRDLSDLLELVSNVFGSPGERHPDVGVIPAEGVNTLGEVMDGPWYVNRHGRSRRMTREALMRGPGDDHPPRRDGAWEALTVKPYGTRTGILIADSSGALYMLRFDPKGYLEMATGATMVASRFFYALGYHVPENYIVYFEREQLVASDLGEDVTSMGGIRDLREEHIDRFLERVAIDPERGYRAVASRIPVAWEGFLGPYQVFGTRTDDPNDIVSHEHRRDLRGLFVFSAWLNHAYVRAGNTMDVLIVEDDLPFVRHYLIDFTATLGSGGTRPKEVWEGNESVYDPTGAGKNILSMGIYTPRWMRAQYARFSSVGNFEYETFEPERWRSNHDIAPFANRLPDDNFWAAKKVMAFTDDDIAAIVSTGDYSDPEAEAWIIRCLIERRSRIGRTYLSQVLALDDFVVSGSELHFSDL